MTSSDVQCGLCRKNPLRNAACDYSLLLQQPGGRQARSVVCQLFRSCYGADMPGKSHLSKRTSPGRSRVRGNTIAHEHAGCRFDARGQPYIDFTSTPIFWIPLISEDILSSLASTELIALTVRPLRGLIPGTRRELRTFNVPSLLTRFSNNQSLVGRLTAFYSEFTHESPPLQ